MRSGGGAQAQGAGAAPFLCVPPGGSSAGPGGRGGTVGPARAVPISAGGLGRAGEPTGAAGLPRRCGGGRAEPPVSADDAAGGGGREAKGQSRPVGREGTSGARATGLDGKPLRREARRDRTWGCGGSARSPRGQRQGRSLRMPFHSRLVPAPRQVTALPLPSLPLPSMFMQRVSYLQRGFAFLFQASYWFRPGGGASGQRRDPRKGKPRQPSPSPSPDPRFTRAAHNTPPDRLNPGREQGHKIHSTA